MFAIRELPVTIEVMEAGKNKSQRYLWCNRAGSEVKLTDNKNAFDISQQFYLKILPASSGIPYLLYSESSKTPLTVGHYRKTGATDKPCGVRTVANPKQLLNGT